MMTPSSSLWKTSRRHIRLDFTDESERGETEEKNNHDNVFGVGNSSFLLELTAEAVSAAGEGETQLHPPAMELMQANSRLVSILSS